MSKEYTRIQTIQGIIPIVGTLVFIETFKNGIIWSASGTGTDWIVEWLKNQQFADNPSVHLVTKETTPAATDNTLLSKLIFSPSDKFLTIEANVRFDTGNVCTGVDLEIQYRDTNTTKLFGIRIGNTFDQLEAINTAGNYAVIAGTPTNLEPLVWHKLLFQIDLDNNIYKTIIFDNTILTPTNLSFQNTGAGGSNRLQARIRVTTGGAATSEAWFSNIIIRTA